MTLNATASCICLKERFEGRDAIYIGDGALLVRVTRIDTNTSSQTITADIAEIPTPGFPGFIGLNRGVAASGRLQWTISAGSLTLFSDHVWSHGEGEWSLFFDPDVIREVLRFSETYSVALDLSAYQRYRNILGWLQCQKSTQEPLTRVFGAAELDRDREEPLPDQPALLREGIVLDNGDCTLRWGTPLHELVEIGAPAIKWHAEGMFLCWQDRTWLSRLKCDVKTGRWFGAPEPRVYHPFLREFQWVHLLVNVQWGTTAVERERGFRELYAQLEDTFGAATFSYPAPERGLPSIHWEFRGMDIGYTLHAVRPSVYISHEPDGYSALKADARAIKRWQGKGARVDYVAWPENELNSGGDGKQRRTRPSTATKVRRRHNRG